MLVYLTLIFTCHFVGEFIVTFFEAPIPGPVLGMLLMFVGLMIKGSVPDALEKVSTVLISNLSLLFVPAGVGVMLHISLIQAELVPLVTSLVVSTVLAIALSGLLMKWLTLKSLRNGGDV